MSNVCIECKKQFEGRNVGAWVWPLCLECGDKRKMKLKEEEGVAFPDTPAPVTITATGDSYRDKVALEVLKMWGRSAHVEDFANKKRLARECYSMADAMLIEGVVK